MWTPKDDQAAAMEYEAARARGNTHEQALRLVMTMAVERKAKSRAGDARAAVAWLRSAATRGAPKESALPFVDVVDNALLSLAANAEALERRLWSAAHGGGIISPARLEEAFAYLQEDPDSHDAAELVALVREHTISQGATVATLQAKVEELEGRLATEEAERIRCRDGWATSSAEVERLKAKLTGADGRSKLLLDAKNHWPERARAAEASQQALLAAGAQFQERLQSVETDRDGWKLVALRALVLNVIVRAQWERYVLFGESFAAERLEQTAAVATFLQFARDRIARRSYEPIPLEACRRLLAAYNESPEEEAENG